MANQLAGNPWILDGSSLNTVLIETWIKVAHFEFSGYTGFNTAQAQLADKNGNIVWNATGAGDGEEVRSARVMWINGLQELIHSSGIVLVYIE